MLQSIHMARYNTDGSSALDPDYHGGEASSLGGNDPYRQMLDGAKADYTPMINPERNNTIDARNRFRQNNPLASAENAAAKSIAPSGTNTSLAEKLPQANNPFSFTGSGTQKAKKPINFMGAMKSKGPIAALGIVFVALAGGMLSSQFTFPFAFLSRGGQEFDVNGVVSNIRSNTMLRFSMNRTNVKPALRTTIFGNSKFKLGNRQLTRLRSNGFLDESIEFTNSSGRTRTIDGFTTVDPDTGERLFLIGSDPARLSATELDNIKIQVEGGGYGADVKVENIETAKVSRPNIRHRYDGASLTWRGKIALAFNHATTRALSRFNVFKNRFEGWIEDVASTRANTPAHKEKTEELASKTRPPTEESELRIASGDGEEADPEQTGQQSETIEGAPRGSEKAIKTAAAARKVAGIANIAAGTVCGVMAVGSNISSLVYASLLLSGITAFGSFAESVDKARFGDGEASPMHRYINGLMVKGNNGKSAVDSAYMGALFTGSPIPDSDEVAQQVNSQEMIKTIGGTMDRNKVIGCAAARIATAVASASLDIVLAIFTAGTGNAVKAVGKALFKGFGKSVIKSGAYSLATSTAISLASDLAVKLLAKDFGMDMVSVEIMEDDDPDAKELTGNVLGASMKRATDVQNRVTLPAADEVTLGLYNKEKIKYIAELAEYERATRSPFDITSEHTFLGSIFYKTIPLQLGFSSLGGNFYGLLHLLGSSFASILPTASAITETDLMNQIGDCPLLESVGAVGDALCDPFYTADFSTMNMNPDDVFLKVDTLGNNFEKESGDYKVDKDDNPLIDLKSDLFKYKLFCGTRDSMLGIADANITATTTDTASWLGADGQVSNAVVSGGIGAIPVVGDLVSIVEQAKVIDNLDWITGQACVTGSDKWQENKYYSQYLFDQEQMESMGIIEKSAGTVALERYYEQNPLDMSYEGTLARISGMTKEDVIATLDLIAYYDFVAKYDPSDRLPVEVPVLPTIDELIPESEIASHATKVGGVLVTFVYNPVFLPLRDRVVAAA
jgi:hypothetical protein